MTEEDTFNALRRTPIKECYTVIVERPFHTKEAVDFIKKNGWTRKDFLEAFWMHYYDGRFDYENFVEYWLKEWSVHD